ncbi:hypothetical protein ATCC90586_004914 [Pythium insidiosum]|nr:hypothetical protein ATCC90586_004914 [Pythium insidiosum]
MGRGGRTSIKGEKAVPKKHVKASPNFALRLDEREVGGIYDDDGALEVQHQCVTVHKDSNNDSFNSVVAADSNGGEMEEPAEQMEENTLEIPIETAVAPRAATTVRHFGVDCFETYAAVANMSSIRDFLSVCCAAGFVMEQLDVDTAYLNADLEEDVYMETPEGLNDDSKCVLKLKKALYGLKQAGNAWFKTIQPSRFRIKELVHLLGMEIAYDQKARTMTVAQTQYIKTIVNRFNQQGARNVTNPCDQSLKLSMADTPQTADEK